jgi:hypothetical protein
LRVSASFLLTGLSRRPLATDDPVISRLPDDDGSGFSKKRVPRLPGVALRFYRAGALAAAAWVARVVLGVFVRQRDPAQLVDLYGLPETEAARSV